MTHDGNVRDFLTHVAHELGTATMEEPTFQRVVETAVEAIVACDFAAISARVPKGRVRTVAATSRVAEESDALQYLLEEGPCLEAIADHASYLIEDVRNDPRWPRWGPRAADLGIGSVLSVRLFTEREEIGALNLYSADAFAWDTDNVDLAYVFAIHAASALSSAQLVTGLQTALNSRHMIGVAQGILIQRYGLTMERSFEVLRRLSSHRNIKLREVAKLVVETGALPDDPAGSA
ncbi:MAG TPA: GAF and ANTAR domain-containing protein [Nocardioidaceae bacterium]|nr:GAF and ANTAR domain-containing protein [Nocardioidaceae bacterium]